jgi:hypothetical protein
MPAWSNGPQSGSDRNVLTEPQFETAGPLCQGILAQERAVYLLWAIGGFLQRILSHGNGRVKFRETGESNACSVSYDLHDKFRAYQRNAVSEYLVWRVCDSAIDWFALREGRFDRLPLTDAQHYHSEVFPGLWLDPSALIRGDFSQVTSVLQEGLASPEHTAFVAKLNAASGTAAS